MKKIRPYRGIYKIPTHRHNKKRYRQSYWVISDMFKIGTATLYASNVANPKTLVTDLQRVYKIKNANITGYTPYKSLADELNKMPIGFWRNLWQNKIRRGK